MMRFDLRHLATRARICVLFLAILLAASAGLGHDPAEAQRGPERARGAPQPKQDAQPTEDQEPRPEFNHEAVFYNQSRMIDTVLADILPSDPAAANVYFVGFASWSDQDVFIREVVQARDIVEERLGASGRSVLLINHPMAVDQLPLASVTNLEIVLGRLGRIMNRDKDVLVLYLTSHGVENIFAVQFPGFPLNHLTPRRLRASLERSGIRNRIVLISSCHSGSFIPALEAEHTLVMTAARADRTSFGCSNERHWTYFGDALLNRALRQTTSLPQAFETAKGLIAKWEREQKLTPPSEPQIFIGRGIEPLLERLARLPVKAN